MTDILLILLLSVIMVMLGLIHMMLVAINHQLAKILLKYGYVDDDGEMKI